MKYNHSTNAHAELHDSAMTEWMTADLTDNNLLRAVVRSPHTISESKLRRLAENVADWDSLVALADEHRVLPLLFSQLDIIGGAVPRSTQQHLQTEYQRNVFHSLANAAELIAVLRTFERESIQAMPFKGPVLAVSAYHDLSLRPAGDLDILIHHRDLRRATALLQERGYVLQTQIHDDGAPVLRDYYEYHFEREADGMVLELRWRLELTQPRFRRNLGMDWVWPQRRSAMLAGAEVPDMSAETTLLVLCMHGCKHVWSRLIWICDVARLIRSSPDLDWEKAVREARRQGLWRALALGTLLAQRIAGAPVPSSVLQLFESDQTACALAEHIEEHLFDAPGSTPHGGIPYNLQLLSLYDRAWFFLSLDFLRPNERDMAAIALPKPLHALYYLIRPFRVFLDRSAR